MKSLYSLMAAVSAAFVLAAPVLASPAAGHTTTGATEIAWSKDEQTAFSEAKLEHRLVMVDFYTDWCGWCKKLDAGAYKNEKVVGLTQRLVALKSNAEKEGTALAKKNGVSGYPTIIFFNPDGTVVAKLVGYQPAPDFANTVSTVLDISSQFAQVKARLAKDPNDGEANAKMANFVALKNPNLDDQIKFTEKAVASKYRGPYLARALNGLGDAYQNAGKDAESIASYEQAVKFAVDPADKSTGLANLMFAKMQKDKVGAKVAADELIALPNATDEWVKLAETVEKQLSASSTKTP